MTDDLDYLLSVAARFDRKPALATSWDRSQSDGRYDGDSPGTRFNHDGPDWRDLLEPEGWELAGGYQQVRYWRRPGKDHGHSATTGHCATERQGDLLYVFSDNAEPLQAGKAYSKFAYFALTRHSGDFSAASKALRDQGYGEQEIIFTAAPIRFAEDATDGSGEDATAADLIAHNATIRWAWELWIPTGVLTILASEPGVGKTRFCADLARRIYNGLPWPDGSPMTLPPLPVLWVAADNQHPELGSIPTAFGFPPTALFLNATKKNPFGGTMLDTPEDLRDFEKRIGRVRPALVFIDTCLNATDRTSHKPEDSKAFFTPLMTIAQRCQVPIVCVTHLNAGGKPLGRRIVGQGRLVMQLEKPDPDGQPDRRKLYVVKSNSLFPPPLGVTMGTAGNEYDNDPPAAAEAAPFGSGGQGRVKECADWLREQFPEGKRAIRVSELRDAAERKGFSSKTIYAAKALIGLVEEIANGKKWWHKTETEEDRNGEC